MTSTLAQRLRAARQAANLTQADVAREAGVTRGAVTQWESKDPETRTQPSIGQLQMVAQLTGLPIAWLLDNTANLADVHRQRTEHLYKPKVEAVHTTYTQRPSTGSSRLAENFWRAVEFEVCQQRPELEGAFQVPLQKGAVLVTVDFLFGKTLVVFGYANGCPAHEVLAAKLGSTLLAEQFAGRPLDKHLLLWFPIGDAPQEWASMQAAATSAGVELVMFREPRAASEYLIELLAE